MRLIRGRLAGVSVRASFLAGMWVGMTAGLVIGAVVGALLVWFAGTVLEWQRDLAFTLGVARTLLPLGDQVAALRWVSSTWFLVIDHRAVRRADRRAPGSRLQPLAPPRGRRRRASRPGQRYG
jgi:hypothetical protein